MSNDTELVYDPLDPAFLADPYPIYRRFLDTDPVHRSPFDFWVVSRHADCMSLLRDPRCSADFAKLRDPLEAPPDPTRPRTLKDLQTFIFLDPPEHTRLRELVASSFSTRSVSGLREFIDQRVGGVVGQLRDGGPVDFIADCAYPLTIDVISRILGLARTDWKAVQERSKALARSLDPEFTQTAEALDQSAVAMGELIDHFREELAQRRRSPRDDLLTGLLDAARRDETLTVDEIVRVCILLLAAGHETTANLLGNGLLALLHPDHEPIAARLAATPEVSMTAIDELLRYDSPIQMTKRVPLSDIELDGKVLETGEMVVLLLGAANRDPAAFPDPDRLDLDRSPNHHLAFGGGVHFCLGARLAREEVRIAMSSLAPLLPGLELVGPAPTRKPGVVIRGLEHLTVRWMERTP